MRPSESAYTDCGEHISKLGNKNDTVFALEENIRKIVLTKRMKLKS